MILLQLIKKVYLDLEERSSSVRPHFTRSEKKLPAVAVGKLRTLLLYVCFPVEVFHSSSTDQKGMPGFEGATIYRLQSEKKLLVISCQSRVREAEGLCCFIYVLLLRTFCGNKNTKHRCFEHSWTVRLKCAHSARTNSYSNADADKEKQEKDF